MLAHANIAMQVPIGSHHAPLHRILVMSASTHSWHAVQVSIVSQEPILFAESIMHNIAYGMPGGSASVSLAMVRPCPALVSLISCNHTTVATMAYALHVQTNCHVRSQANCSASCAD